MKIDRLTVHLAAARKGAIDVKRYLSGRETEFGIA